VQERRGHPGKLSRGHAIDILLSSLKLCLEIHEKHKAQHRLEDKLMESEMATNPQNSFSR
jgi:hypothetical protein